MSHPSSQWFKCDSWNVREYLNCFSVGFLHQQVSSLIQKPHNEQGSLYYQPKQSIHRWNLYLHCLRSPKMGPIWSLNEISPMLGDFLGWAVELFWANGWKVPLAQIFTTKNQRTWWGIGITMLPEKPWYQFLNISQLFCNQKVDNL